MIGPALLGHRRPVVPVMWHRYRRDGRWHADATLLLPQLAGSVTWPAPVVTSDARTRLGRELHVIRGRIAIRRAWDKAGR